MMSDVLPLDIFANVLNQRSEHDTGVWMSGIDVASADALRLPGNYYEPPPVIGGYRKSLLTSGPLPSWGLPQHWDCWSCQFATVICFQDPS